MNRSRSISYAPFPTGRPGGPSRTRSLAEAEWTLCRDLETFAIANDAALRRSTAQGRIRPDDYLVRRDLDVCIQAKDIAELDAVFRARRSRRIARICDALGLLALALVWFTPLFGTLVFVGVAAAAFLSRAGDRHPPAYHLSVDSRQKPVAR